MTMSPNVVGELEGPRVYSWGGAVGAQKAERGRGKSYKGKERGAGRTRMDGETIGRTGSAGGDGEAGLRGGESECWGRRSSGKGRAGGEGKARAGGML